MPEGAGKYDDLCTYVRETADADGAIVIIFGGNKGGGMSIQGNLSVLTSAPDILRAVIDEIERSQPTTPH
jgi:hypothetical protein